MKALSALMAKAIPVAALALAASQALGFQAGAAGNCLHGLPFGGVTELVLLAVWLLLPAHEEIRP